MTQKQKEEEFPFGESNPNPKPEYCPCCRNSGLLVFSPGILTENGVLDRKGRPFTSSQGFACGCRVVGIGPEGDKFGKQLIVFTKKLQEAERCMSEGGCNPTPGDGKFYCPKGQVYWKQAVEFRLTVIKDHPDYKRGLELIKSPKIREMMEGRSEGERNKGFEKAMD